MLEWWNGLHAGLIPPSWLYIKQFILKAVLREKPEFCRGGGTGIRVGLKNRFPHGYEGSTPSLGTTVPFVKILKNFYSGTVHST